MSVTLISGIIFSKNQLFNLEIDPAELNNLFERPNLNHPWRYKRTEDLIDGELRALYLNNNKNLKIATEKYFGDFVKEEYAKGYKKPKFPNEIFKKMYERYRHIDFDQFLNFWRHLGIIEENKSKDRFLGFGWCQSLTDLRRKIDEFQGQNNNTWQMKYAYRHFSAMDQKFESQYF